MFYSLIHTRISRQRFWTQKSYFKVRIRFLIKISSIMRRQKIELKSERSGNQISLNFILSHISAVFNELGNGARPINF